MRSMASSKVVRHVSKKLNLYVGITMTFLHKDVKMGFPQIRYFIIKKSFHLPVKLIRSYPNERKCKNFGFGYQRKILKS